MDMEKQLCKSDLPQIWRLSDLIISSSGEVFFLLASGQLDPRFH